MDKTSVEMEVSDQEESEVVSLSGAVSGDDMELNNECEDLERQAVHFQEELKKLSDREKRDNVKALRKEVRRLEQELTEKRQKWEDCPEFLPASKDSIPVSKGSTNKDTRRSGREKTLQISDIRRDSNKRNSMRASVKNKLHAVNAVLESDSEDEGISHLSGKLRSCTIRNQISGKHGGRKGRKNSDNDDPIFPNDVLGPQHAVKPGKRSVEFQDLNLRLLCLGESMICSSGVLDAEEVQGRLSWLSHLLTYAKSYKFSAILTLHEEMIHQVHFGERTWFDDHASLVAQIVIPHPLSFDDKKGKSDKSDKSKGFTYFCGKFNSEDGCDEQDRHKMFFKGEYVTAHHVCSSCLVKDKKQFNHSRMSDICPHKK
jgi:hypothetical protein